MDNSEKIDINDNKNNINLNENFHLLINDNKKIAFMFLCRGEPYWCNLIVWEKFFENIDKNLYKIIIHTSETWKVKHDLFKNSICTKLCKTEWGKLSLVEATFFLIKDALLDENVEKLILLSESCAPLINFQAMQKEVFKTDKSYFKLATLYKGYHESLKKYISKENYKKQSQWMILSRKDAIKLVETEEKYISLYKNVSVPDEHYFINILTMEGIKWEERNITYVNWLEFSGHKPKDFIWINDKDIEELKKARECGNLFARKFHPMSQFYNLLKQWVS